MYILTFHYIQHIYIILTYIHTDHILYIHYCMLLFPYNKYVCIHIYIYPYTTCLFFFQPKNLPPRYNPHGTAINGRCVRDHLWRYRGLGALWHPNTQRGPARPGGFSEERFDFFSVPRKGGSIPGDWSIDVFFFLSDFCGGVIFSDIFHLK